MDEVFERQAPEMKDFLLKTFILEGLSAPLCITLIGWYQRAPKELIRSQPDFGMAYAWAL
jgi:ATP/maltotriose-dependent transcriptional regulator MalT